MELGRAIGAFKQLLMHAVYQASEGRADIARELLESMNNPTMLLVALEDILSPAEIGRIKASISEAIAQKTASMIERKAKVLYLDLEEMEKRAEKLCR